MPDHHTGTAVTKFHGERDILLADPFRLEDPLSAQVHVDAAGWLRPDAYSELAVEVNNSVLSALNELRSRRK